MEDKEKNETQSRREFFKEAAKKALPILGAVVLLSNPIVANSVESETKESAGCVACEGKCLGSCKGSCYGECKGSCQYECIGGCKRSCSNTCKNGCYRSCIGTAKH